MPSLDSFEKLLIEAFVLILLFGYREPLLIRPIAERVFKIEQGSAYDLGLARARLTADETARFIDEHMSTVQSYPDRYKLFQKSIAAAKLDGLFCEFGVADGASINFIADLVPSKAVHGFDSFEGLPETWRSDFGKGSFATGNLPAVRKNVILHKGWFDRSVPEFHAQVSDPIAFVHMDADLYSSTATVLEGMADRIVPGTVIQFDEFFNYPGWRNGEFKAYNEFVERHNLKFSYVGYSEQQVAVIITR